MEKGMMKQWSVEMPHTAREDRGSIRRSGNVMSHPELGADGCRTLYEALRRGGEVNPLGPCLGFRAISTSGFATPYVYSSYTESIARVDALAAGLDRLELVQPNDDNLLLLGIYMKNCMEWILAEHGVYTIGGATVPLYDTLGPQTVQFVLEQTGLSAVVCTRAELAHLCEAKATGQCPKFQHVILVDGILPEADRQAKLVGLHLVSFAKVEAVGAQSTAIAKHKHNPPSGKDLATFCYTSGTTGNPKGALITHENLMSNIAGMHTIFQPQSLDRHLSYLPLPHIFERVVVSQILLGGASIAFYRGDPLLLIEDIQACRPTIMPAAPRVLNKIHDKIQAGMVSAGGAKKRIFDAGLAAKTEGLKHGHLKHGLYDPLIFNKLKKALGLDHVRFMVSGSAPLAVPVMTFFRCMLGVPIVEGYGQTEGTAGATVGDIQDMASNGHVGGPTACTEIVLLDVPEMGYLHTDRMHRDQPCHGRGEILVRGPNVFAGYYKEPEKTKEAIDEEGWLHSGDIGLWTIQGQLQIIDRKKEIFKLAQGEYVSAEKVENILIRSPLFGQCFVYGDSLQSALVAIVVPDEEPVRSWAAKHDSNLAKASFPDLCKSERLKVEILKQIQNLSKANGLQGFETVRAIYLEALPFTVENGLVTPTFKLKRQQLRDYYEQNIAKLYDSMPPPPSKL